MISGNELNLKMIIIQNAAMILLAIAKSYPQNINMSPLCELHALYVKCYGKYCALPPKMLQ